MLPLAVLCITTLLGMFCVLDSMGLVMRITQPSPTVDERRLQDANQHLETAANTASEIGGNLANGASNVANGIGDHWDEHGDAYKEKAGEVAGHIHNHAKNAANAVSDHWNEHGDAYKEKAGEIAGHIGNHAKNAWNGVSDHWNEHGDKYKDKAGEIAGHIGHHTSQFGNHVWNKGSEWGGHIHNHLKEHALTYGQHLGNALTFNGDRSGSVLPSTFRIFIPVLQLLFAVLYYFVVVSKYPEWMGPTSMSARLQSDQPPCATLNTSPTNCLLSWLCPQARAAHTFDKTRTLDYWLGLLAMFCCPFCTLCYANSCTDLNAKLGGERANLVMSCLCTWCCSPCVIAQDAESLDEATRVETGFCGVSSSMPQGMPPGMDQGMHMGMHPGMNPGMHQGMHAGMHHGMPQHGSPMMMMGPMGTGAPMQTGGANMYAAPGMQMQQPFR